jgi:iron complex outermembrane recepter protein
MLYKVTVRATSIALCTMLSFGAYAMADAPRRVDIPAGDLAAALLKLSKQYGTELVYRPEQVRGFKTRGAHGNFTSEQVATLLLQGTPLELRTDPSGAMLIAPPMSASAHAVDIAIPASGAATQDAIDGPKEGKKSSSGDFRVAQVGQITPGTSAVDKGEVLDANSQSSLQLDEIVVTAQRRAESLDKVAVSVTAYSQKTMDELHIQTFEDLASVVPGLSFSTPGTSQQQSNSDVAIRGIYSGGNSPTTGIYIDETPITVRQNLAAGFSGSPHPDIFDLDRIEVLRGPQGTLFGSSAMGGVIRFITPQPDLEKTSGYSKAEFSYTERGAPSYEVGMAYGAPIVEGVAGFRFSGWFHSDGGFIDIENPYTGQILNRNANSETSYTLRPAFTYKPTDSLTITPAVFIQHQHTDAPPEYWRTDLPNPEQGAFASGYGWRSPEQPATDDLVVPSLAIKFDFAGLSLQSDTSYVDRSYTGYDDYSQLLPAFLGDKSLDPALSGFNSYDQNVVWTRAWQQEFRLSSQDSGSRLNWVVGAYYRHALDGVQQFIAPDLTPLTEVLFGVDSQTAFGNPDFVTGGLAVASYSRFTTVTEQKAVFGEITYEILPRVKANVGLRIENSQVKDQIEQYGGPLQGTAFATTVLPDQKQTPKTPRFGLTYQYTDKDMVYATAAKGYRPGGSNSPNATVNPLCQPSFNALGLTSVPNTYESDSLWSYELGAKDSLFDNRLSFQTSVYYIDWSGIQTTVNLPSCGAFYTANRGKAISQGFDFQVAAIVVEGLKVSATLGYTDAYYPLAQFGASVGGVTPLLIGAGDKLPNVAPWSASLHADYSRDISPLWDGARSYFRVDYRWTDATPRGNPALADYDPTTGGPIGSAPNQAYGVLNLRLGLVHGGLDVSAFVENLTNSDPILGLTHASVTDTLYSATAIRPRTMGVTGLFRF